MKQDNNESGSPSGPKNSKSVTAKNGEKPAGKKPDEVKKPAAVNEAAGAKQSASTPPEMPDFSKYAVRNPENFVLNIAKMVEQAGKAATHYIEQHKDPTAAEAVQAGQVPNGFGHATRALSQVTEYWLSDPKRALDAQTHLLSNYLDLWNASIRKMSGEKVEDIVKPDKADRRFNDPDWQQNEFLSFLKQAYLLTSNWANELVERTEGLDETTRLKARFYTEQILNALAPTNFPNINPEVIRDTLESDGENLAAGAKMFAEDLVRGHGELRLRQTSDEGFEVGVNIGNTPGKVVAQNEVCQVIQYQPTTDKVLKRPLVIVPPWINKFYILDLNPKKSFVKYCVDQGHTVFVISWVNPDERHADKSFEHYAMEGIINTLDVVEEITGENRMNMIGYCVGGTLLAVTLAYMAKVGDKRAASATFFTTQVDFTHAGDLKVFVDEPQIYNVEKTMEKKGYLDGSKMAAAFNLLRSRELIWPYVINNYMRGKEPMPFDLLYWNSDSTRMPAANHSFYLRNCYLENRLSEGTMELAGKTLDLSKVKIPVYNLATREDHIAPAKSVFLGSKFFGGKVKFVLTGSGHIAGVVNPPASEKYQYWTGPKPKGSYDAWLKECKEHPGSWWPHWHEWIEKQDDEKVDARRVGSNRHPAGEDAPGSYVKTRV